MEKEEKKAVEEEEERCETDLFSPGAQSESNSRNLYTSISSKQQ